MKFAEVSVPKYNLADAVSLHTELNPKVWQDNAMRPEVRERLLDIAQDFVAFIGIDELDVEDIVVIGSNVAYSYTPHSDLDLHVVVDFAALDHSSVYAELFNSKKYQYNDMHNIMIRGINVELYVQDAAETPASLGMYSVLRNQWIVEPVRRPYTVNDAETKIKYTTLRKKALRAIKSRNEAKLQLALDSINRARKTGLASSGEFGPENLAYKMLRTQGVIQQVRDELEAAKDAKLSLESQQVTESSDLMEINMSPSNLTALASNINALAGMEFEMYVPDTGQGDEFEREPDYSHDTRVSEFDEIISFFDADGGYNSRADLRALESKLTDDYEEWYFDREADYFDENTENIVRQYLEEEGLEGEELDAEVERVLEEDDTTDARDSYHRDPVNYGFNEFDEYSKDEWATNEFRRMKDVENRYEIVWPYWRSPDAGEREISSVAEDFQAAVGRKVKHGRSYHSVKRDGVSYVLEPDGSLDEPNDSSDGGLEFVSPPLPINELLNDLKKVKKWADRNNCYTNESTGLHINVSIPNADKNALDYAKLALLLGDKYVLDRFERSGNTYCKSAMDKILSGVADLTGDKLELLMNQMKSGLDQLASRVIMDPSTVSKHTSIHPKDGYIEFRSPGGDWLNENFDKIEATLLRMVVALDAAYDPNKYRQEYLKKLYKMLAPKGEGDPVAIFAKYATGEFTVMPKETLKFLIGQLQQQRVRSAHPAGKSTWWEVKMRDTGVVVKVSAPSKEEAINLAAQQLRRNKSDVMLRGVDVTPINTSAAQNNTTAPSSNQQRWNILIGGTKVFELSAENQGDANQKTREWLSQRGPEFRQEYAGKEVEVVPQ